MNTSHRRPLAACRYLPWVLLCSLLAACASKPRTDWATEVGLLTFEEAKAEMGNPIKTETLPDGSIKAEWLVRTGQVYQRRTHSPMELYETESRYQRRLLSPGVREQNLMSGGRSRGEYVELIFDEQGLLREARPFYR